jgi:thiamine biosynthesis lipoprotein
VSGGAGGGTTPRRLLTYLLLASATTACTAAPAPARLVEEARPAMGSVLRLSAWTSDVAGAHAAFNAAFAEFDRLETLLSVWQPGSDVARLNAAAGREPLAVSDDTRAVLAAAAEAHRRTNGAFDVTFGALADVWRFDHDQDNRRPTDADIRARLPLVDQRVVVIDRPPGTAFIERPGARVHLGGIGKGYAVDRAAAILRSRGVADFMIQGGGDLYAAGRRDGRPWRVGIQDPRGPADEPFATLDLSDRTLSTSGDYERFFIADGVRYHHLLDPETGQPARGCRSVSIVASGALEADWLSTGVFVMGPKAGLALVEDLPDVEAVIVTDANEVLISSGLTGLVTMRHPPTP